MIHQPTRQNQYRTQKPNDTRLLGASSNDRPDGDRKLDKRARKQRSANPQPTTPPRIRDTKPDPHSTTTHRNSGLIHGRNRLHDLNNSIRKNRPAAAETEREAGRGTKLPRFTSNANGKRNFSDAQSQTQYRTLAEFRRRKSATNSAKSANPDDCHKWLTTNEAAISILRGPLNLVDDDELTRSLSRFELHPKLFLQSGKDRRTPGCRGGLILVVAGKYTSHLRRIFKMKIEYTGDPGPVHNRPIDRQQTHEVGRHLIEACRVKVHLPVYPHPPVAALSCGSAGLIRGQALRLSREEIERCAASSGSGFSRKPFLAAVRS